MIRPTAPPAARGRVTASSTFIPASISSTVEEAPGPDAGLREEPRGDWAGSVRGIVGNFVDLESLVSGYVCSDPEEGRVERGIVGNRAFFGMD